MSSLIVPEFDTVYTPDGEYADTWHGMQTCKGEPIKSDGSNIPKVFVPIVESKFTLDGIDNARLVQLDNDDDASQGDNPLKGWKMILAEHEKGYLPLHVPKAGYVIHQNRDLFRSFITAAE